MFQLKDMRLFIMPVTTKLLTEANYAFDREFAFAKEMNIPILPLMQESGLDNLFNKKCGAIQYLDKNDKSQNFEKKLGSYLSSISSNATVAEKIRSAFDAHIFLSYRKKDRAYARELMSLIHENDSLSGISIWYDDYLVPGENYNDTIKEAIQKSDIFVMAITPNMVNERNYVVSCEYPEAVASQKVIVPCKLLPTEDKSLADVFPGMPASVDAHDKDALLKIFLGVLSELNITVQERTPERDYLIGLSYLDGIDVEADSDKALRLITSAARSGYSAAMAKLATMYHNGIGVKQDKKLAKKWCCQYIKTEKSKLKESDSAEDAEAYLKALSFRLESITGDSFFDMILAAIGIHKLHKEALRLQGEDSFYNVFYYITFGELQALRHRKEGVGFSKAIDILNKMPETKEIAEYMCEVYSSWTPGRCLEITIKNVSEINRLMIKYCNSESIKRSLEHAYLNIFEGFSIKKKTQTELDAIVERAKAFYDAVGDEGAKRMLAECYRRAALGISCKYLFSSPTEDDAKKIIEYYRCALELSESLAAQTKLLSDYERVINILFMLNIHTIYDEEAKQYDLRTLEIAKLLGIKKLSVNCKKNIADVYEKIARSLEEVSKQTIDKYYNTSLLISDVFSGEFDSTMDAADRKEKASYSYYMQAILLRESIVKKEPGKDDYLLGDLLGNYCDMVERHWAFVDREHFVQKAEELAATMTKKQRKVNAYKLKYMYLFMANYESDPQKRKQYQKLAKKYK
jgi:TPR repeat protein